MSAAGRFAQNALLCLGGLAQACSTKCSSTTHHIATVADGLVAIAVREVAAAVAAERGVRVQAAVPALDN